MRQINASAAVQEDLLDVALANESLTQAKARSIWLGALVRTGVATLIGVCVCVVIVNELFYWTLRAEIQRKQLATTNALLVTTRAQEQSRLTQYRWVKKSDGVLRIPLERAKSLVIADYAQAASTAPVPSTKSPGTVSPAASASSAPLLSSQASAPAQRISASAQGGSGS